MTMAMAYNQLNFCALQFSLSNIIVIFLVGISDTIRSVPMPSFLGFRGDLKVKTYSWR